MVFTILNLIQVSWYGTEYDIDMEFSFVYLSEEKDFATFFHLEYSTGCNVAPVLSEQI